MHDRTARQEILDAIDALERRQGRRDHSVAEILDEVRAQGGTHKDSTIRTHVISSMCINAPANHATRYDDLERVGHGRYRRSR